MKASLFLQRRQCIRICCMSLPDCIICYLGMQQCQQLHHSIAMSCYRSAMIKRWTKLAGRCSLGCPEVVLDIFLWFCPVHGHSYGFHLISGGEGRKDPFCSLFKYCQTMPEHIYYDFACQLSEYCLNREPELFKSTRFWYDLFHFIGHLCGINFKSGRILGKEGVNN